MSRSRQAASLSGAALAGYSSDDNAHAAAQGPGKARVSSRAKSLLELSRRSLRTDPQNALNVAKAAIALARKAADPLLLASGFRVKGNALHVLGDNAGALRLHAQSLRIFRKAGVTLEIARTENSTIQPLLLLGRYAAAMRAAVKAMKLFKLLGDNQRLAYVELNLGNIYHRQDRFEKAIACYRRAYRDFVMRRDKQGIAAAFSNMSSCLVGLNDFQRALRSYRHARGIAHRLGMASMLVHTDFNVAYLHFLQGQYGQATELLKVVRGQAGQIGDLHLLALSDLVLSEIYTELNLATEALETARNAAMRFRKLGMGYEVAKALSNEAIILSKNNHEDAALRIFGEARDLLVREKNRVWPSIIDLYRAEILAKQNKTADAKQLSTVSAVALENSGHVSKGAFARLMIARLELGEGNLELARENALRALNTLSGVRMPILTFRANYLLGRIEIQKGELSNAFLSLEKARRDLEALRTALHQDELKVNFIRDKDELFERLVDLCLERAHARATPARMFEYIELAKARGLMELMRAHAMARRAGSTSRLRDPKAERLRSRIHWHYRRIEQEQLTHSIDQPACRHDLQGELARLERDYAKNVRAGESKAAARGRAAERVIRLREAQRALEPSASLLEYFLAGDNILATVIRRGAVETRAVAKKSEVFRKLQSLQMQLSKFKLGTNYVQEFSEILEASVRGHLQDLYSLLVRPIAHNLGAGNIVVIPHAFLHSLPFHALHDGETHLLDRHTVSYAPSASIYSLVAKKRPEVLRSSLILGVPDAAAPLIADEVRAIASILPGAELHLGRGATERVLRTKGTRAQLVHVATHGNFRQDNPAFSTIKLFHSYLNLYDLYEMSLPVSLITLSGCGTGLNAVSAGDEHLGLTRGLLSAGAQSLLLSLWDVNDQSTTMFMIEFYGALMRRLTKREAFRTATLRVRKSFPHPYHWAPFILVGNSG